MSAHDAWEIGGLSSTGSQALKVLALCASLDFFLFFLLFGGGGPLTSSSVLQPRWSPHASSRHVELCRRCPLRLERPLPARPHHGVNSCLSFGSRLTCQCCKEVPFLLFSFRLARSMLSSSLLLLLQNTLQNRRQIINRIVHRLEPVFLLDCTCFVVCAPPAGLLPSVPRTEYKLNT